MPMGKSLGAAVTSILSVLSALGVIVFPVMLVIALMEGLDGYQRRWR